MPFHVTHNFVAFIQCGFGHNAGAGNVPFPCTVLPLNHMLGIDVTEDQDYFTVEIPYTGLANVLYEGDWRPQQLGHDILVGFVAEGQGVLPITDVTDIYGVWNGGPPLRIWVTPGQEHQRGEPKGEVVGGLVLEVHPRDDRNPQCAGGDDLGGERATGQR